MNFRHVGMTLILCGAAMLAPKGATADPPSDDLLGGPKVSDDALKEAPRRPGERAAQRPVSETPLREWIAALRELDLTAEQRQEMRKLADDFFAERRKFRMSHSESEREMMDDLPWLREQGRESIPKQREMLRRLESQPPEIEEFQRNMWAILTPPQQEQFKAKLAERRDRHSPGQSDRRQVRRAGTRATGDMMQMPPDTASQQNAGAQQSPRERRPGQEQADEQSQRRLKFLRSRQSANAKATTRHSEGEPSARERVFTFDENPQPSQKPDE